MLRQIYFSRDILSAEYKTNPDKHWIGYALLQIAENDERNIYLNYYNLPLTSSMELPLLLCMVDSREVYSFKHFDNKIKQQEYCRQCAEEYHTALQTFALNERLQLILLHHRGKMLGRCNNYAEAVDCFKQVIERKPDCYPAYVQLAKLGTRKANGSKFYKVGETALDRLLSFWIHDKKAVPLRVMLQAVSRLTSYRGLKNKIEIKEQYVQRLGDIIFSSAMEGFGQWYEAFAAFTSLFAFHYPQICNNIAKAVPALLTVAPNDLEERQWINACEAMANVVTSAKNVNDVKMEEFAKKEAARFIDNVVLLKSRWNDFELRAIIKVYNVMGNPYMALQFLQRHGEGIMLSHWTLYRKAETEMMLGMNESIASATQALEKLKKDEREYVEKGSSYYALLAKCNAKIGNKTAALENYGTAIEKCNDDKYKKQLQAEMDTI